eukprot:CAMPEP_0194430960 /NCGR_PEP_ID=MMETSP0176-20130528/59864_1 /TAXON_ID=216777 /ORGANISM="Proboscia alata, Strain PI-D3" /LENGTH=42 /DNA_ID= /DNA_START= /DNA_END= /DNA_ORIENTATION=
MTFLPCACQESTSGWFTWLLQTGTGEPIVQDVSQTFFCALYE